jgi:hypothetical protein
MNDTFSWPSAPKMDWLCDVFFCVYLQSYFSLSKGKTARFGGKQIGILFSGKLHPSPPNLTLVRCPCPSN